MTDSGQHKDYELNEKDIDTTLNFLRIFDPEHATPERAIDFLHYMRLGIHELAHSVNEEELEKLYNDFAKQKPDC